MVRTHAIIPAGALPPGARIVEPSEAKPKRSRKHYTRLCVPDEESAVLSPDDMRSAIHQAYLQRLSNT